MINTNNIASNFFTFSRPVKISDEKTIISKSGIAWNAMERFYMDENDILNIVLKSQTEGQRMGVVFENKKQVQKPIKQTMNVIVTITEKEDIERFFKIIEATAQ